MRFPAREDVTEKKSLTQVEKDTTDHSHLDGLGSLDLTSLDKRSVFMRCK